MVKLHRIPALILIVILMIGFSSCGMFRKNKEQSTATGWNYNDPTQGGFEKIDFKEQPSGPGLILIEGGTFVMGATQDNVMGEWNNTPRRVTVRTFYMDQTEVSNLHYLEFLYWVKKVFYQTNNQQYQEYYVKQLPDTLVWRDRLAYNEPMVNLYLRHPAYRDYPVVGVSWLQANEYCRWRTDRVNEMLLYKAGVYNLDTDYDVNDFFTTEAYLGGFYTKGDTLKGDTLGLPDLSSNEKGAKRRVRMEDGIVLPNYRLPTEAEWEYAALGLIGNTEFENIKERRIYPWNGNFTRINSPKEADYGQFAANFRRGRGDYMGVAGSLNDAADIPAPVISYYPNDFGLYNMAGNVAEWVLDVYRPSSFEDFSELEPFRGNIFTAPELAGQGKFQIDRDVIKPDGTPNENFGRFKRRPVDSQIDPTLPFRRNYRTADNRNYLDGDWASLSQASNTDATQRWKEVGNNEQATNKMYYNGEWNPADNKFGEGATSLITDRSRVYKGGSWKDGAYFLSPSVRRFLEENLSTDYIGFRCAMDRVGTTSENIEY
ncbi:MAG TPA: gliding motility lipoprotein GldJ [Bacteroidales bacterium]|jgi:gliding motility-associated lipoprotein GldJ|nr:gliding motility lipoprotein GldJ [Bacteroidales bacterium]